MKIEGKMGEVGMRGTPKDAVPCYPFFFPRLSNCPLFCPKESPSPTTSTAVDLLCVLLICC